MRFLTWLLFVFQFSNLLAAEGYVYLADKQPLYYIKGEEIYSPDQKQLLYFKKGNIFFTGSTDEKQNIFLLSTSTEISNDKLQYVYEKDSREPYLSFSNHKFYVGETDEDTKAGNELLHIEHTGKWLAFYSSITDSLLAYYTSDSLPASAAVITAYAVIKKFNVIASLQAKRTEANSIQSSYSTIKPAWGNVTANEWIWDGKVLRPRWNPDPKVAWTFDGQTVKQMYVSNIYEQYQWDGETFKPVWRNSRAQEWSWDGRIMKPTWDTDWANQYTIESGVLKPWSNVHPEKEWLIDGSIPVPILIIIVSGIARSY